MAVDLVLEVVKITRAKGVDYAAPHHPSLKAQIDEYKNFGNNPLVIFSSILYNIILLSMECQIVSE